MLNFLVDMLAVIIDRGQAAARAGDRPQGCRLSLARRRDVKRLLVSQMYPGPGSPDFGVFVAQLEAALEERGHVFERAVIDRRVGGHARSARLVRDARSAARRFRPDVVYAHFLVPAGLAEHWPRARRWW